jgi:hypothetical protein
MIPSRRRPSSAESSERRHCRSRFRCSRARGRRTRLLVSAVDLGAGGNARSGGHGADVNRRMALRADETGLTVIGSPLGSAKTTFHFPWPSIEAIVLWGDDLSGGKGHLSNLGVRLQPGAPPVRHDPREQTYWQIAQDLPPAPRRGSWWMRASSSPAGGGVLNGLRRLWPTTRLASPSSGGSTDRPGAVRSSGQLQISLAMDMLTAAGIVTQGRMMRPGPCGSAPPAAVRSFGRPRRSRRPGRRWSS